MMDGKNRHKILATGTEYYRRRCELTRRYRVTKEELRRTIGIERMSYNTIEDKDTDMVWSLGENKIKKVTEWSPTDRRRRGDRNVYGEMR